MTNLNNFTGVKLAHAPNAAGIAEKGDRSNNYCGLELNFHTLFCIFLHKSYHVKQVFTSENMDLFAHTVVMHFCKFCSVFLFYLLIYFLVFGFIYGMTLFVK